MNIGVLIFMIIYEVGTIVGVGTIIARRKRRKAEGGGEGEFALASKGLPTIQVGFTLALTMLGSAHIWGTTENAYTFGGIAVWFGIACAVMMVVITQITGPWVKKIGTNTMPGLFGKLFGKQSGILTACVMAGLVFGPLCFETQCIAVTISACTGWPYWVGALVGAIFGILYVLLCGMKEVSILNIINAVFMYGALVVALVATFIVFPGNGWADISNNLTSMGDSWMLGIFGNGQMIISFAIPSIFCCTMFQGVSQMGLQTCIAAESPKTVKKSSWLAVPVNGMFCVIPTLLGMAALGLGFYAKTGSAMMMTPIMIVELLPHWIVALLLAGFLGALLSTFAMASLCPATIFAYDLYGGLFKPHATEKEKVRVMRILIVILGAAAFALSTLQPAIVTTMNWIFTWAVPFFIMLVIGLLWKRNTVAFWVTCFVSWVANVLWVTFDFQTKLNMPNFHQVYLCMIITVVLGVILTAALPGGKPGFFRMSKEEQLSFKDA